MKSPILYIGLYIPPVPLKKDEEFKELSTCLFLNSYSTFLDQAVFAFGTPEVKKSPELGKIFNNLLPRPDGSFEIELAATLPELLPNAEDRFDYYFDILDEENTQHRLYVSNQMLKFRYRINKDEMFVLIPRGAADKVMGNEEMKIPKDAPMELLKTTVVCRFKINGSSAEEALENHLEDKIDELIRIINKFVKGNLIVQSGGMPILWPTYSRFTFPCIYLLIQGIDEKTFGHCRFATNPKLMAFNPGSYEQSQLDKLKNYLNGSETVNDWDFLFLTARSYFQSGSYEFAMLQAVIAAEVALSRYVFEALSNAGVSKTKLDDNEKDITFAEMLNIYLQILTPHASKPDLDLMGKINELRRIRNKYMHEAKFDLDPDSLKPLIDKTQIFLEYINALLDGLHSENNPVS